MEGGYKGVGVRGMRAEGRVDWREGRGGRVEV